MRHIKEITFLLGTIVVLTFVLYPATINALPMSSTQTMASAGVSDARDGLCQIDDTKCHGGQSSIGTLAQGVVSIISYIAGIIAVIMIMISGFRYMTSDGDSAKVSTAKTALIYALIGLAVVGLTQLLIHLVLSSAANA